MVGCDLEYDAEDTEDEESSFEDVELEEEETVVVEDIDDDTEEVEETDGEDTELTDDRDQDGLLDVDEEKWGTDPDDPDSDSDTLLDGEEVYTFLTDPTDADTDNDTFDDNIEIEEGTNPLYRFSHSYTGGYDVGYGEDGMATATGPTGPSNGYVNTYQAGDVARNFTLVDQHGEDVSLYSFCGKVVMLAFGAEWCPPCRDLAAEAQELQEFYGDDGFQIIEMLLEDSSGNAPGVTGTRRWANTYDMETVPVLDESVQKAWPYYERDFGIPTIVFIDRDGTVLSVDEYITNPSRFLD